MEFKIGMKFRIKNKLFHVLAIIDDNMVVVKYWSYYKCRWEYEIRDDYSYIMSYHHAKTGQFPNAVEWRAYDKGLIVGFFNTNIGRT